MLFSYFSYFFFQQTSMSWEREKKLRADVEKVKRKVEGDLKVCTFLLFLHIYHTWDLQRPVSTSPFCPMIFKELYNSTRNTRDNFLLFLDSFFQETHLHIIYHTWDFQIPVLTSPFCRMIFNAFYNSTWNVRDNFFTISGFLFPGNTRQPCRGPSWETENRGWTQEVSLLK